MIFKEARERQLSNTPIDLEFLERTVQEIQFRDWTFRVEPLADGFYVQPTFMAPSTEDGTIDRQNGRKWYISKFATIDEIIKTVWLGIEIALRHEAMEDFKVDGLAIFHPHTSVSALIELQNTTELVRRQQFNLEDEAKSLVS